MEMNRVKQENKKAFPKFILVVVLAAAFGGVLGFGIGIAGDVGLPEAITAWLEVFWRTVTPWAIPVTSVVLLGAAWGKYRLARKQAAIWDGEDEAVMDRVDQELNWTMLLGQVTMIMDFFLMAAGSICLRGTISNLAVVGWFILSCAVVVVIQQKVVDLTRAMNPEKQGSVYDMNFQKKWFSSCDEAERAQIGQAAYRAFRTTSSACIFLWMMLVLGSFLFDFGLMPVFVLTVIWGVLQVSYLLECVRMGRGK